MIKLISTLIAFFMMLSGFISDPDAVHELNKKGDISTFSQSVNTEKELPVLYCNDEKDFTVLQFSDTHFTTLLTFSEFSLLRKIKAQTEKYAPALVVISGDMIDDGNDGKFNKAYVLRSIAEMFEELNQFWAYVPGNNDGINYGTSEDVVAYLSQYEHCLVSDEKEISGGCQYSIDISDTEGITHSLIFIDTMDYDNEDEEHIYGYVLEDQVQWCKNEIAKKKALNKDIEISVFLHENTPDFFRAARNGQAYKFGYPKLGIRPEKYNIPKNQPLDNIFTESGCIGLLSMGHNHPLTVQCNFYENTYYHVTPQAQIAATLITIHTDSETVKDMYDFCAVYV